MSAGLCNGAAETLISLDTVNALKRDADSLRFKMTEIDREIDNLDQRLVTLRGERDALFDILLKIESLIAQNGELRATPGLPPSENPDGISALKADGLVKYSPCTSGVATVAELVEGVIRSAGMPLHYKEILNRLQREGADIGGKDPAATLLSVLASKRYKSRFVRAERGVYTLFAGSESTQKPSKRRRRRANAVRSVAGNP